MGFFSEPKKRKSLSAQLSKVNNQIKKEKQRAELRKAKEALAKLKNK